jgi:D-glycero-D-manno-heptose 1,7-bisphosphate phosphatase
MTAVRFIADADDFAPRNHASGCWCELAPGHLDFAGRPALFLDRDGVIVEDTGYACRAEDAHVLGGAAAAIARCNKLRIPVIVVSNQSGIARGLYDWNGFAAVQGVIDDALAAAGARLDAVFACAHHGEGQAPLNIADHPWRKPSPGMLMDAAERMTLDLPRSWIAGDRASDIAAGKAAGLAGGILILSPRLPGERDAAIAFRSKDFIVEVVSSLIEAVALLLGRAAFNGTQSAP